MLESAESSINDSTAEESDGGSDDMHKLLERSDGNTKMLRLHIFAYKSPSMPMERL